MAPPKKKLVAEGITEMQLTIAMTERQWTFWPDRVTAKIDRLCRAETGASASVHWANMRNGDWGVDSVVALVWVASLQSGLPESYVSVEALIPDRGTVDRELRFGVESVAVSQGGAAASGE